MVGVPLQNLIAAGVVVVITVVIFAVFRRIQTIAVRRVMIRNYTADMVRRVLMGVVAIVALFYIFGLLDLRVGPLLGGIGISSIIAAIALQPVFGNFIGSIMLHSTRAFTPGDEIETNGITGTVVDISHRAVQITDFDGNSVYVPNMRVLDTTLVNLTADDPRRTLIGFQVAYDTDLRTAKRVVTEALEAVDGVAARPSVQVLVRSFADSGIDYEAEIWHPAEEAIARRVVSESAIVIRETLADNDITIPFPQLVIHDDLGVRSPDR